MNNVLRALPLAAAALLFAGTGRADEPVAAPAVAEPAAAPASSALPAVASAHDDFREPGRFGLVGAITDDAFQFGVTRVGEHYEVVLTADASFASLGGSTGLSGATGDLGATLRAGPRFALGHLNHLSLGAQGRTNLFGQDNGVSTQGTFSLGPYVGIQRNFAGTPLMITLWVLPYEYSHDLGNDGAGKQVAVDNNRFFQTGGFGRAYLL